jgi:hypothetical protein
MLNVADFRLGDLEDSFRFFAVNHDQNTKNRTKSYKTLQ